MLWQVFSSFGKFSLGFHRDAIDMRQNRSYRLYLIRYTRAGPIPRAETLMFSGVCRVLLLVCVRHRFNRFRTLRMHACEKAHS